MKSRNDEIEIDLNDVKMIMQEDYIHFDRIVNNCYCIHCSRGNSVTLSNYKAYFNSLNDIILKGSCKNCGNPIARYIETGEQETSAEIAEHIRSVKAI